MSMPLGKAIGNKLEVIEAIKVLKGLEKEALYDECILIAAKLISLAKNISLEKAKDEAINSIESGKAYKKFEEFVIYQHGDLQNLKEEEKPIIIRANKPGTIKKIHALEVAKLSYQLGALRTTKDEKIDYNAGVYIERKIGDKIAPGDVLMKLYTIKKIDNINLDLIFEIS